MRRSIRPIILALAIAALAVASGSFSASAVERVQSTKVFGGGDSKLKPDCPRTPTPPCYAIGSVTAFITQLENKEDPFVAPSDGKIVAWAIELGNKPSDRVTDDDSDGKSPLELLQDVFGSERYGKGPVARLAILKRQGAGVQFKLTDQSPAVKLSGPFYNKDTVITLDRPLPIQKGEIVGVTDLTWIPFARSRQEGGGQASWRASRDRGKCGGEFVRDTKPQKRLDSIREYGCKFTDRLFYKAYFVPN